MLTMRITGDVSNIMPSPQGGACIAIGTRQGTDRLESAAPFPPFFPFLGGGGSWSGGGIMRCRTIFDRLFRGFLFKGRTRWDRQTGGHC